ncbi:MAG: aspartate aminotransferase family protein [Dehalococcoidia bacterium]
MEDESLLEALIRQYVSDYPKSNDEQEKAKQYLIDGGSHALRLFSPYPFRIVSASGSRVRDADGHEILDFWQGHYANILGHNPPVVTQALRNGNGLQTGITEALQMEFGRLLLDQVGSEQVRFTTSGSLATMYAIMLARAFTGKPLILKVGGGWHGAQPLALKGVHFGEGGYTHAESEGLSEDSTAEILITRCNDPDDLRQKFRQWGDRISCFIVEPWMGVGGFMPATPEYLKIARELTRKYEAVLIFDEIISGFRFCASGVQRLYDIRPDLSTFGKIIGGGMPLAVVVGREEIMRLCGSAAGRRVRFDGGTFSAHPAALLAGKTLIEHLVRNEEKIYPRLGALGQKIRLGIEEIFASHGILARCTGYGNDVISNSSLVMIHFPYDERTRMTSPEAVWDPKICHVHRREKVLKLALLLERVHVVHGLGAVSMAHSEEDVEWLFQACDGAAKRMKQAKRQPEYSLKKLLEGR